MVTDYEIYQEIDEFDEDLDTDDLVDPEDLPPISVVDYDYPEGDIQYVDMVSDKILDPADLAGRRYCTFIDKWAGFIQLEQQIMEWVDSCPWLAFDIETYKKTHEPFKRNEPPGWRTDLMGAFSISDGETTYVLKLDPLVRPDYTNEENLKPLFMKILDKPLVGHNLKFDLRFMMRYYDKYPPLCFDTFLAAKVIHCARGVKYDLKSVVERYLKIQLSKKQQRSAWGSLMFLTPQISYSGRDTFYVAKLVAPMVAAMDKDPESWSKNRNSEFTKVWGLKNKVAHLEFYLLPRLMLMEHHGVFMNIDEVEHQFNRLKNIEGGLKQKWFNELADLKERPINPNSSKKVFQFLTGFKMGGQGFIRPDGNPMTLRKISSIDQDEIKEFVGHGIPCIDALVDYKSTTGNIKRIEEFHKLTDPKTTRLYTSFKQWGAVSGRTSCPKPNLQNIKNAEKNGINLRSLFMAPPGRKLVVVDYSQIQLVIIAEISQDQTMRDIINSGGDLHTATAIAVSGHSNITKDERKGAKSVNFGYCVDPSTPVLTEIGYKPIQHVLEGEYVLTHRGNWRPVTRTFSRTVSTLLEVTTNTGKTIRCTPEHMLRIKAPDTNGKPAIEAWMEVQDLKVGMYLVANTAESKHGAGLGIGDLHAKVLGWIISKGGVLKDGSYYISMNKELHPLEVEEMSSVLPALGFKTQPSARPAVATFVLPSGQPSGLREELPKEFKVSPRRSDRSIALLLPMLNRTEKLALLAGLWDGQGAVYDVPAANHVHITYQDRSSVLLNEVRELLESLGLTTSMYTRKGRNTPRLRVTKSASWLKFLQEVPTRKGKRAVYQQPTKQYSGEERVTEVKTLTGEFKVCDIEVADDHSFIANGLVSHNCFGMGPQKFQEFARMSYKLYYDVEHCQLLRERYFNLYPGVARWHKKVGFGKRNGFYPIQTLYGRKITADGFTKATNFPVQGTEKDIVALAISFITDRLIQTQLDGFLVNCIHDELVAEVSEHDAEYVREIMSEEMVRAAHMILKTVKVRADGHIVDMWSAAK